LSDDTKTKFSVQWSPLTLNTQGVATFYWDFVAREYNCFIFFILENSSNKTHFINGNIKQEFFVCFFFIIKV